MTNDDINRLLREYAAKYPPLITFKQAAAIAQVPLGSIYDWSSRGEFDPFKHPVGRRCLLDRDAFVLWLLSRRKRRDSD